MFANRTHTHPHPHKLHHTVNNTTLSAGGRLQSVRRAHDARTTGRMKDRELAALAAALVLCKLR